MDDLKNGKTTDTNDTGEDMALFNYDDMVQDALKQVVRNALKAVIDSGFSGGHHFYVTFRTDHPRSMVPPYISDTHPEEITIVLQYQFWDLELHDDGFSVTLSFNDVKENLYIPFDSITSFVDPSVKFGLQFAPKMTSSPSKSNSAPQQGPETSSDDEECTEGNVIFLDAFRKK